MLVFEDCYHKGEKTQEMEVRHENDDSYFGFLNTDGEDTYVFVIGAYDLTANDLRQIADKIDELNNHE